MNRPRAYIASVAPVVPPYRTDQAAAHDFLADHFSDELTPRNLRLMHSILSNPAISHRNFAVDDPRCLVDEDPDNRIERFTRWSVELSSNAAEKALETAGLTADDVSGIVVNTCTGYICPGISTYLIERMGLSRSVQAYDLVGSGCGGAIPNLQIAESRLNGSGKAVLSISVEVCSATFQMDNDLSLILSNALFADGATAAVIWDRPEGLKIISSSARYVPEHRDHIRYIYKNGRLHNKISTQLPRLVVKAAAGAVEDILKPLSLSIGDIRHWALHNGGEKIINELRNELGLKEEQVGPARDILRRYGNMSSPTVWFVLREIMDRGIEKGEWCMMVAFGAGLSAHACLLRKV